MKEIIPAVLVDNFNDFSNQIKNLEKTFTKVQIDVMDGEFVDGKSFNEIAKINELNSPLKFEVHLMVSNPLQELQKWVAIKNIFRVIFHIEAHGEIMKTVDFIKAQGWQVGIAINPETPTDKITSYLPHISEVLFMTVIPGRQGNEFQRKVLKKISEFSKTLEHPLIAADGGIHEDNIVELSEAGVEIFNIGSTITLAKNTTEVYEKLKNLLKD